MSIEGKEIVEITGCSPADAMMIEYIIREEVFHSTLDWQTPLQFRRAARKAAKILAEDRLTYQEYFATMRAQFEKMRQTQGCMNHETSGDVNGPAQEGLVGSGPNAHVKIGR